MKTSRLISALLALIMAISLGSAALAVDAPTLTVSQAEARPGDTAVSLDVVMSGNPGINTFTLTAEYDTSRLALVSISVAEGLGGSSTFSERTGKIVWQLSRDTKFNGQALTLTFDVLESAAPGAADVTLIYEEGDICNYDEDDISFAVIPGGITIQDVTAPVTPTPTPESTVAIALSGDCKTAKITGYFDGLYARMALILSTGGQSGLYVTQTAINPDGTVVVPQFMVPGLRVTGVNIALVPTLGDIVSPTPTVVTSDFKML